MKTGVFSVFYAVISYMAIGFCFTPILLLGWKKIRKKNAYCVLGFYWFLNGLVNLPALACFQMAGDWGPLNNINYYYDLAEAPLILLAYAFANPRRQRIQLTGILLLFVAGEILLIGWKGYNSYSTTMIVGAGLLLVLICSAGGLLSYMNKMEHSPFENSMAFIYSALLFADGSFLIIYLFIHLHPGGAGYNSTDGFLLYYISLLLSVAVTSIALLYYGVRTVSNHRRRLTPRYSSSSS